MGTRAARQILSIYNPTSHCALHEQPEPPVRQPKAQRPQRSSERPVPVMAAGRVADGEPERIYCSPRCRMAAFVSRKRQERVG